MTIPFSDPTAAQEPKCDDQHVMTNGGDNCTPAEPEPLMNGDLNESSVNKPGMENK